MINPRQRVVLRRLAAKVANLEQQLVVQQAQPITSINQEAKQAPQSEEVITPQPHLFGPRKSSRRKALQSMLILAATTTGAGLYLSACGSTPPASTGTPSAQSDQNKSVVMRFFHEVGNDGNASVASQLFTPNADNNCPKDQSVGRQATLGPSALLALLATYKMAFSDLQWHVDELLAAEGDQVVARWSAAGTHTGILNGIPPTGKQISVAGIWIFQLVSGKITHSWNAWDALGLLQQLGSPLVRRS